MQLGHVFILLFLFQSAAATASVPLEFWGEEHPLTLEPIENSSALRLLGKGIRDKETKAALTLACLDEPCSRLRWVLHTEKQGEYWLGAPLSSPQGEQMHAYLKGIHKFAKKESNSKFFGVALYLAGAGAFVTGVACVIMPLYYASAAFLAAGTVPLAKGIRSPKTLWTFDKVIRVSDQDGWNWASNPAKTSHRYFASVLRQVARRAIWESQSSRERSRSIHSDPLRSWIPTDSARKIVELVTALKAFPRDKNESFIWNQEDQKFRVAE